MKPTDRIAAINQSLRVFVCGIFSLCPFLGILPAAMALAGAVKLSRYRNFNPAARYATGGAWLAALGLVVTLVVAVCIGFSTISQSGQYGATYGVSE
jgi:hypothetical protein